MSPRSRVVWHCVLTSNAGAGYSVARRLRQCKQRSLPSRTSRASCLPILGGRRDARDGRGGSHLGVWPAGNRKQAAETEIRVSDSASLPTAAAAVRLHGTKLRKPLRPTNHHRVCCYEWVLRAAVPARTSSGLRRAVQVELAGSIPTVHSLPPPAARRSLQWVRSRASVPHIEYRRFG